MILRYARVPTTDQTFEGQRDALTEGGAGGSLHGQHCWNCPEQPRAPPALDRDRPGQGRCARGKPHGEVAELVGVTETLGLQSRNLRNSPSARPKRRAPARTPGSRSTTLGLCLGRTNARILRTR